MEELFNEDNVNKILHYHGTNHRDLGFIWTYDRIRNILTNEIYTGTYRNKRIVIENHSPQIIDREQFDMVQEMMRSKNKKDNHLYLFKSLCFDSTTGKMLYHRSVVKPLRTYLYYENEKKQRINQNDIEKQIRKDINKYINNTIQKSVSVKINTIKKKDYALAELDRYFDIGFINEQYYMEEKSKLLSNIKFKEDSLDIIAHDTKYWDSMIIHQQRKFLIMNVSKIEIDLSEKK